VFGFEPPLATNPPDSEAKGTVFGFEQKFATALEDAIEFHAFAPLEALPFLRYCEVVIFLTCWRCSFIVTLHVFATDPMQSP
jgi:hypothetical protein